MASFSRGLFSFMLSPSSPPSRVCVQCLFRAQNLRVVSRPQQRRLLSISRTLSQQAKSKRLRITTPRSSPLSSPPSSSSTHDGLGDLARQLNMTLTEPTVIYQAPSHRTLIIAASGLSLFFISYGVLNAWQPGLSFIFGTPAATPQDRIAGFIPPVLIVVGCALVGLGIWSYGAIHMMVKRITVLPQGTKGDLMARLEVSRLAPWRTHELTVPITSLSLGRRMQDVAPASNSLADRYRKIGDAPLLLRPFLRAGSLSRTFFEETKNVFWRVPFVTLAVRDHGRFTLDSRGAAYKGSIGLDRLIPFNYKSAKFWDLLS